MKSIRYAWIVAASTCLMMGMAVRAQENLGQSYSTAQIEQFVAPVALYPDALLAQVLMASTYPYEVVEASRWTRENSRLNGDSLADALDGQNWDVSVKSLVPFPDVLYRMAQNEAWTQDLGNAFLVQPNDCMNAVQSLRHHAYDAGNLRTSDQQRVVVVEQVIQVVPVSPQIIFVPAYNSMVVYGPDWGYPTYYYPAMMAPPSYYVTGSVMSFGVGFAVGAALFGAFDWNQHNVYYGPNFYQYPGYRQNVAIYRQRYPGGSPGGHNQWEHDPGHRGPGGYQNPVLEKKYGHGNPLRIDPGAKPADSPPKVLRNPAPGNRPQEPKGSNPPPVLRNPAPGNHPQEPKGSKESWINNIYIS